MERRQEQYKDIKMSITNDTDLQQYTYPDFRVYVDEDGDVYASVTSVLDEIKPDKFLEMWKEKEGSETVEQVLRKAAQSGSLVHDNIEKLSLAYQAGEEASVFMLDDFGKPKFSEEEWKGIMRFVDFFNNYVDEVILTEQRLHSKRMKVAGTVDMVARLKDGRVVLIDHKFANALSPKYSVQSWAYREMFTEMYGEEIDGRANLWLKAHTRGADKAGKKIQGEGWQLVFHEEDERDEIVWNAAHTLFFDRYRTKPLAPLHRIYPTKLTLK
jgi:hypothetical protein